MNLIILISTIVLAICLSGKCTIMGGKKITEVGFLDRNYTTIAKGLAILLIMTGHCSGLWAGGRLATPFGGIGVAVFLIASGFGLNESYKRRGLQGFWRKRLLRVYIPYFIAIVVIAAINCYDWKKFLLTVICYDCPYWFVKYIIQCYVFYWIVSVLIPRYRVIIFLIISASTLFYMPDLQAEQAFSFTIGIVLSAYKDRFFEFMSNKKYYVWTCLALLIIGIVFLAVKQIPVVRMGGSVLQMNTIQCLIKMPLGLFVLFGIGLIKPLLSNPLLYFTGLISYELYLVHFPFYLLVGEKLWPAFVLIISSYIVGYLFYKMNNQIHLKLTKTQ